MGGGTKKRHGRWDEKTLEARLPTAPLGVETRVLTIHAAPLLIFVLIKLSMADIFVQAAHDQYFST